MRRIIDRLIGREVALKGGMSTPGVVRVGDTVRRPARPDSAFSHELLRHLELRGFDRAPRFLGIDEKGRAMLTFIPGTVSQRVGGFQREQWLAAARLLRRYHDATVDCDLRGESEVVCHGDPGPGNCVLRDGIPFAFIDFDGAHPGDRADRSALHQLRHLLAAGGANQGPVFLRRDAVAQAPADARVGPFRSQHRPDVVEHGRGSNLDRHILRYDSRDGEVDPFGRIPA